MSQWGPTHTEIKYSSKFGPTLIEINARWHAQNTHPITTECLGADAVSAALDAYFDPGQDTLFAVITIALLKCCVFAMKTILILLKTVPTIVYKENNWKTLLLSFATVRSLVMNIYNL